MTRARTARLTIGLSAVAAVALTACGGGLGSSSSAKTDGAASATSGGTITVGYVSPQTGPLAGFGEADQFVVKQMTDYFGQHPLDIGGKKYAVKILVKDSGSDSKRAGEVAASLINNDHADVMLASSTPDTVNPVADQCEANSVPCITTVAPWQPYYFGRGATPDKPFTWTYHFFWGLEDVEAVYTDMWNQVQTDKKIGAIWPNDPDGNAWGDPKLGFSPVVGKSGYSIVDPGHYANGTQDYTAQIAKFKGANADVLVGVPIPPDFTNFWKQAKQQGYNPKIATIGKALLFPSSVEALGSIGQNLGTEVWWSPSHPFTSSLTQQSAKQLADAYEQSTGKQWTQPLGFVHALFEVMNAAYQKAGSTDKMAVATALKTLNVDTVVGKVAWGSGPVPNVAKTEVVGGQWRQSSGGKHPFDLVIVSNSEAKDIPLGGKVEPLR